MPSALSKLIQNLQSRVVALNRDPDIFSLPQNETDWSIFSHKLPSGGHIWIHTGVHNNICYALRIGKSNHQSSLRQQWVRGINAIRHVLTNLEDPPSGLLHARPNEVDFYRQCMSGFGNHQVLIYKTGVQQEEKMAQVHRVLLPFFSRAHPEDGASMFGQKSFSTRLIADSIMGRSRLLIVDILPPANDTSDDHIQQKPTPLEITPPSILFSAFVLSLRRLLDDDSQWKDEELICQFQGHDPSGGPLLLGMDTKRDLLRTWLSVASTMPRNIPWHYEPTGRSSFEYLYFSRVTRSAFGPHVSIISAKQKEEHYRIEGLWLFRK